MEMMNLMEGDHMKPEMLSINPWHQSGWPRIRPRTMPHVTLDYASTRGRVQG